MQLRTTLECNGRFSPYYAYWLFSLFSRHIFRTQSFQQNGHIIFLALVALTLLVSLISRLVACSARIVVDRHTDTQIHRQTHRTTTVTLAAHARRGLIMAQATSHAPSLARQPYYSVRKWAGEGKFSFPSPAHFRTRMRIRGKIRLARETTTHHAPATARAPRVCTLVPFIIFSNPVFHYGTMYISVLWLV